MIERKRLPAESSSRMTERRSMRTAEGDMGKMIRWRAILTERNMK